MTKGQFVASVLLAVLASHALSDLTWAEGSLPGTERLELHSGANVVRWLGADDVSLAAVLQGLDEEQVFGIMLWNQNDEAWSAYRTSELKAGTSAPAVQYGDYLALYLLSTQTWDRPVEPFGVIHFSTMLTAAERERVTNDVRSAEQLLADRFGVEQDRYELYVAQDWSDAHDLLSAHGHVPTFPRDRPSGGCPALSDMLLLVNRSCYTDASKAASAVADAAVRTAPRTGLLDHYLWFGFLTYTKFASLGPDLEAQSVEGYLSESRSIAAPLAELHELDPRIDDRPLWFLATIYLAETFGDRSLIRYFDNLATGGSAATALAYAFQLSIDDFYAQFEAFRSTVAPPISGETERVIVLGQKALKQASEIRRIVAKVEQWFVEAFAYPAGVSVWRVDSNDPSCGLGSSAAIRIGSACLLSEGVYAHEYFHVLQRDWSTPPGDGSSRSYPPFMLEGSATFVDRRYSASVSGTPWTEARPNIVTAAAEYAIALDDPALEVSPGSPEYILGALATEWLQAYSGGKSVADYYRALSAEALRPEDGHYAYDRAGERSFQAFWGISIEDFYPQFACWRARGFPIQEAGIECVSP